ncbi:MAG: 30S ribosomal protein S19e [Nitrososphaerota archaeon]|nr:MAG: 30S ribosomal protein S19e [Nitrososphaerota archaeon]
MAKVYDVPADMLIKKLTEILKSEDINPPTWISFVKTGVHADKPPQQVDWWYTRCASILRKIYLNGPISITDMRSMYGGGKARGYGIASHRYAGGAIIRNAVHGLEKLGYVEMVEKKGRIVTKQGMKKLDNLSTEILKELIQTTPKLKIYS